MSTVDHDGQPTFGISNTAPQVDENKPALLSLPNFSKLHLEHILSHPPDSILFPFLHGLEGDNDAQNTFFASCSLPSPSPPASDASTTSTSPNLPNPTNHRHRTVKVPRHRGLVWVVCEDDLQAEPKRYARELALLRRRDPSYNANNIMTTDNDNSVGLSTPVLEGDSESSDYDDDDDDEDIDMDEDEVVLSPLSIGANAGVVPPDLMDVDGANGNQIQAQIPLGIEKPEEQDDAKHMHPVIQRLAPPVPMPIQTTELHLPSSLSSTSMTTSESSSSSTSDNFSFSLPSSPESASISTSPTSTSTSPKPILTTPPSPNPSTAEPISSVSAGVLPAPTQTQITSASAALNAIPNPNADLALLTCTFRPCDIVRPVPMDTDAKESQAGGWEFVPAKVPDGISLRNFGIQVPIYTTLSDIVVYSPKGPTQNAYALAGKIQEAINKKYQERARRLGGSIDKDGLYSHPDLLHYNVFLLDCSYPSMISENGIPHLIMRLCDGGPPGVEPQSQFNHGKEEVVPWGAHTDGPDGHVVDMEAMEEPNKVVKGETGLDGMYVDLDAEMELDPNDVDSVKPSPFSRPFLGKPRAHARDPNTVDFAQREKEEMRDLTKASEIISVLPPDGQVGVAGHVFSPSTATEATLRSTSIAALSAPVSTTQSHPPTIWAPHVGQVFLGNSDDVPLPNGLPDSEDAFDYLPANDPARGHGFDICIECHDLAPFPTHAHLKAVEEHLIKLDELWVTRVKAAEGERNADGQGQGTTIPPRPPPNVNSVLHLSFPSSPTNSVASMNMLMPFVRFLERWLMPVVPPPTTPTPPPQSQMEPHPHSSAQQQSQQAPSTSSSSRRWSTVASFMPHFPSFPLSPSSFTSSPSSAAPGPTPASAPAPSRLRSLTSPSLSSAPLPPIHVHSRTRPLKILLYSLDGYTESSLAALCLLMAIKHLSLPEAYLELQVTKRRSFFVYQSDLGLLRRVESRLREEAERERVEKERERDRARGYLHNHHNHNHGHEGEREINGNGKRGALGGGGGPPFTRHVQNHSAWGLVMENGWRVPSSVPPESATQQPQHQQQPPRTTGRPAAKSVSFGRPPPLLTSANEAFVPGTVPTPAPLASSTTQRRPRANTSPWLPSFNGTHHSWFNDRRFDGSFPSRVLPFLYLGNLNHASNAYMLHALGITHVVSVGECALVPPPYHLEHGNPHYAQPHHSHSMPLMNGKSPGDGSLWHEEREGRIKVLDIKNVCDDGIDTLEPQLEPICDWIDKARAEGGQVLVHCRVGVSRSATVTIAYVMKHLGLPLVDAYLIVRSRRLSVLIQPNMRLLYNLCGWEIKLAKARAGDSEENLRNELARTLSWPYLAKEVHALNEKYLHAS